MPIAATILADGDGPVSLAPIHDDLPTFMSPPQDGLARYGPSSTALFVGLTAVEHWPAEAPEMEASCSAAMSAWTGAPA
jgi:hypothetical protein